MNTIAGRFGKLVAASLLLAPAALASEAAPAALAAAEPGTSNPLELGAPPAWGLLLLGASVVAITILRRMRKTVPQRVPRR